MVDNPYKVLGISENATQDEIKTAYRKKAKENHPDLHPDDPKAQEKMNEINEAYDILSSPEKLHQWRIQKEQQAYYQQTNSSYTSSQSNYYSNQSQNQNPYGQSPYGRYYRSPFGGFYYRSSDGDRYTGYSNSSGTNNQNNQYNNGQNPYNQNPYNQNPYNHRYTYRRGWSLGKIILAMLIIRFLLRVIVSLFGRGMGGFYY